MVRCSRFVPYIPLLIVLGGVLSYLNTFGNPFIFDDLPAIVGNRNIGQLWPVIPGARWIVNLSFRLNYALAGFSVAEYHAVNLLIHIWAALLLFGIVRRTLALPGLRTLWGDAAPCLAGVSALLFVVHPLQTGSVSYLCQRYESMMGLFFLGTLYAFIRAVTAGSTRSQWGWATGTIALCLLGMGTKEVMLTAPFVLLLYDWIFLGKGAVPTPSPHRPSLLRWFIHVGCFASLLVLLVFELQMVRELSAGGHDMVSVVSPWLYLATQTEVILHYLRLAVWPTGQCLDYAWPIVAGWGEIWPAALAVIGLGLLTLWGTWKRMPWAFLGGWFFLILAPSSSLLPAPDAAFEHRMYLPLAAVLVGYVIGAYRLLRSHVMRSPRMGAILVVAAMGLAVVLGWGTHLRNRCYATSEAMWRDVMAKQPGNYRQRLALFHALFNRGDDAEAEQVIRSLMADTVDGFNRGESSVVAARDPFWHYAVARGQWGRLLLRRGDAAAAVTEIASAIRALPGHSVLHHNMARALSALGRYDEALLASQESLRLDPSYARGHGMMGFLLVQRGDYGGGAAAYREALRLSPPPHHALSLEYAWLLATAPDAAVRLGTEAERIAAEVSRALEGRSARALDVLAAAQAEQGRFDEAIETVKLALALAGEEEREGLRERLECYGRGEAAGGWPRM
ncbi:MAG: tetratricopeptide repeat protein [Lentisphaerae bacterium]|nr:tetratricopeptide repeat protein [Lentisphaerota bacterium]